VLKTLLLSTNNGVKRKTQQGKTNSLIICNH